MQRAVAIAGLGKRPTPHSLPLEGIVVREPRPGWVTLEVPHWSCARKA